MIRLKYHQRGNNLRGYAVIDFTKVNDILNFWFGTDAKRDLPDQARSSFWFGRDPSTDMLIRARFSDDLNKAIAGEYEEWQNQPRSRLALIILFDQFTRNIYRDDAKAFAYDNKALDLALQGIALEHDRNLPLIERVFFYLPLEHSESLTVQKQSVAAFQSLLAISLFETRELYENFLAYAVKHYEVIKQFGRFPSRNAALGRESTIAEQDFLKLPQDF